MSLSCSADCLLAFIDDTGNESFRGQTYFGLGGVLVAARENELLLKPRWRALRAFVHGSEDQPLHASELGHSRNEAHIEAAGNFFRENDFCRFGISTHARARVPPPFTIRQPVYEMLKTYVGEAAEASHCDSVALIFESSKRGDRVLQTEFGPFIAKRQGVELPVEYCVMPKSANEPGLEVADFVANAVGGMARRMMDGSRKFGADFCAIFHGAPAQTRRYIHIDATVPNGPLPCVAGYGVSPI